MKNTYTFLLLILAFFAASCNSSPPAATGGTIDLQGFNATNIPGSDAKLVTKKSADGKMPVSYTHLTLPTICSV